MGVGTRKEKCNARGYDRMSGVKPKVRGGISNVIEADTLAARIILVTRLKLRFMARMVIVRDSGLCLALC